MAGCALPYGLGKIFRGGSDQCLPWNPSYSSWRNILGNSAMVSSQISFVPFMSSMPGRKPRISWLPAPRPVPNSKRPLERWSSMATFSATLTGWFTGASGLKMPEPRWIRSVACARYPRKTSFADRCEYSSRKWCSEAQAYLKPDLSAWMTYSVSSISALCSASGSTLDRDSATYPCTKSPNSKGVHRPLISDVASDLMSRLFHRWGGSVNT